MDWFQGELATVWPYLRFLSLMRPRKIGQQVFQSYLNVQKSLPAKFQQLKEACQQAETLLDRAVQSLFHSGLKEEEDVQRIQELLSTMVNQLFHGPYLLKEVESCKADFTKGSGGYCESFGRQEEKLRRRHLGAKYLGYFYTPAEIVNVNADILNFLTGLGALYASTQLCRLTPRVALGVIAAVGIVGPIVKFQQFDARTDFEEIQAEVEDKLCNVRKMKHMGPSISGYYEELEQDIKTIQSHEDKFLNLSEQVPLLKAGNVDVDSMDAEMLGAHLRALDLPDCADKLLRARISGHAFMKVLEEKDFEELGMEGITLRRLMELQAGTGLFSWILRKSTQHDVGLRLEEKCLRLETQAVTSDAHLLSDSC